MARRTRKDDGSTWTVADSRSVYGIRHWGAGYFAINDAGHVEVSPRPGVGAPIDVFEQVRQLRDSGLSLPLLLRFPDILQDRVRQLTGCFDAHIARLDYQNRYTALYPIKVNQQEAVVESIIATENVAIGLEAGSKPELMAVLALAPKGGTIVCNGYKDREFIRLALIGQKLGHNVFIVIEKESEVPLVIEVAAELQVAPQIGLRVRLSSLASSKWADTGGEKSKFGLSAAQLLAVIERFRAAGLDQGVRLLHFHMGSQIANIADYRQRLSRGDPLLRRTARPGPAGRPHRRRRRPGRGLRRHPLAQRQLDQLRHGRLRRHGGRHAQGLLRPAAVCRIRTSSPRAAGR